MKKICLLVLFVFYCIGMYAQNEGLVTDYEYSKFRFVGYQNSMPVFYCNFRYDEPIENAINFALYTPKRDNDGSVSFKFLERFKKEHGVYFLNDNYIAYRKSKGKDIYIKKEDSQDEFHVEKIGGISIDNRTHYLTQGDYFYFSTEINKINYLARVDVTQKKPQMEILPIKGQKPMLYDQWLYYVIGYETSPGTVSYQSDIYRVKIEDLRNPELVIEGVYSYGNVIDEDIVNFKIYLDDEMKHITYNIPDSTYMNNKFPLLSNIKARNIRKHFAKARKQGKHSIVMRIFLICRMNSRINWTGISSPITTIFTCHTPRNLLQEHS